MPTCRSRLFASAFLVTQASACGAPLDSATRYDGAAGRGPESTSTGANQGAGGADASGQTNAGGGGSSANGGALGAPDAARDATGDAFGADADDTAPRDANDAGSADATLPPGVPATYKLLLDQP